MSTLCNSPLKAFSEEDSRPLIDAELLDRRILNLLIRKAIHAEGNGCGWFGLSVGQTLRALGMKLTRKNMGEVRSAYSILEREGKAYSMHGSVRVKWYPSTREIEHHAFGQANLKEWM